MKKKFIDIRTIGKDGILIDVFNINHASVEQLMSVLQLAEVGSEVTIIVREEEVTMPFIPAPNGESASK